MLSKVAQSLVSLSSASAAPVAPAAVQLWHRGFAFEKGPQQTDAPNPKKPLVQEDSQGVKQQQKEQYESIVAQVSGVAEDVTQKDQASTSLGKMGIDQRGPQNERVKEARAMAESASEREMEDEGLADAVFDDKTTTSVEMDKETNSNAMIREQSTATDPQ
ncbi:hypothetical protein N2152v2_007882 [Parachlorella kessleri]